MARDFGESVPMSTRTLRARLDNPKLLRKPQVLARSTDQFNEINFIFNLSSAFANDRLAEYLNELTGRVNSLTGDIEEGIAFGDLVKRSYHAMAYCVVPGSSISSCNPAFGA